MTRTFPWGSVETFSTHTDLTLGSTGAGIRTHWTLPTRWCIRTLVIQLGLSKAHHVLCASLGAALESSVGGAIKQWLVEDITPHKRFSWVGPSQTERPITITIDAPSLDVARQQAADLLRLLPLHIATLADDHTLASEDGAEADKRPTHHP